MKDNYFIELNLRILTQKERRAFLRKHKHNYSRAYKT